MSREVRRVPLDWKHPVTYNEHWEFQANTPYGRSKPQSQLHGPTERFVGLRGDYPAALARWEEEAREVRERAGHRWDFAVEYHLTGYQGRGDDEPVIHPFYGWTDDGMTETATRIRDEDHLHELLTADVEREKPDPADYMPVFDVPELELGWCLYQTVSEGAPVTPVFSTAEELIEHLCTVGQDWDQQPMRRAAAEQLVSDGHSFGSFVRIGNGPLMQGDTDADRIASALGGEH